MDREKQNQQIEAGYYLIELLRSALNNETPKPKPPNISWELVYWIARKHCVEIMAYEAARRTAEPEAAEIMKQWRQQTARCTVLGGTQQFEKEVLKKAFLDREIRMLPLKGWVMRELYPRQEWRQMADLDLLIDSSKEEEARRLMEGLGYTTKEYGGHNHDVYEKPPWLHVELHCTMLSKKEKNASKYENIWERVICQPDGSCSLSWEDYCLYFWEHLAGHYDKGGCGIRFIADVWVLQKKMGDSLDRGHLEKKLKEHGLWELSVRLEALANAWFGEGRIGEFPDEERYLIVSGIYGTREQARKAALEQNVQKYRSVRRAKLMQIWKLTFLNYQNLCVLYPRLRKYPVLMPVYTVHRIGRIFLTKRKEIRQELAGIKRYRGKIED